MAVYVAGARFGSRLQDNVHVIAAGTQGNPAIARLIDGGFVAIWQSDSSVWLQRFNSAGQRAGNEQLVATNGFQPSVTGLSSGGFAVSWAANDGSLDGVWARSFDASGSPHSDAFRVNADIAGSQQQPAVFGLPDGNLAVAWTDNGTNGIGNIKARILSATGTPKTGNISVTSDQFQNNYNPQISAVDGGGFALSWTGPRNGSSTEANVQVFNSSFSPVGIGFSSRDASPGPNAHDGFFSSLTTLASGQMILTWTDQSVAGTVIMAQRLSSAGMAIGGAFQVSASGVESGQSRVRALEDGGFVVTWRANVGNDGPSYFQRGDVVAQVYGADGAPLGSSFVVSSTTALGQDLPSVAQFGTGDLAFVWHTWTASGQEDAAFRTFFTAKSGTEGADFLTGAAGVEYLNGLGGDDQLIGVGHNETIEGDAGNDALNGGGGNDTLNGGAGNDTVNGGDGNDTLDYALEAGTLGAFVNLGPVGSGHLITVPAGHPQAGRTLSPGEALDSFGDLDAISQIDNVITGGGADIVHGNDDANRIETGGGNDQLGGFGGNDTLVGQGGNDTLNGGDGIDTAVLSGNRVDYLLVNLGGGQVRVKGEDGTDTLTEIERLQLADGTFVVPAGIFEQGIASAINNFGAGPGGGGWSSYDEYPRDVADINGDGRADIVGFGIAGTYVALGQANGTFGSLVQANSQFGQSPNAGGWSSNDRYPRMLADVNGDGRADIVGFGIDGTLVALANGSGGFGVLNLAIAEFGTSAGGWSSNDRHPRMLADVNGDGRADIVGFGIDGTLVSLANGSGGFGALKLAIAEFGTNAGGWSSQNVYHRTLADVNGDGRADIVGFGVDGALIALGSADGTFRPLTLAVAEFGTAAGGWTSQDRYPRGLADVNGDDLADIIGFGEAGVYYALNKGTEGFGPVTLGYVEYANGAGGWSSDNRYPRMLADVNGDGLDDIIGFGETGVFVTLADGFEAVPAAAAFDGHAAAAASAEVAMLHMPPSPHGLYTGSDTIF